jgi:hypothetical protein
LHKPAATARVYYLHGVDLPHADSRVLKKAVGLVNAIEDGGLIDVAGVEVWGGKHRSGVDFLISFGLTMSTPFDPA